MAKVEDFTDPFLGIYTPPPAAGDGVCTVCHGVPTPGYERCWSCEQSISSVSRPIATVVPISWYRVGEQLHSVLRGYKDSPDEGARQRYRLRVAATLHRFMRDHAGCLEAAVGTWDAVTIVPSKSREGAPPLEQVIKLGKVLKRQYKLLLVPAKPQLIDRAAGSDAAFTAKGNADGVRVLLIDDTFTSGATLQSAASALRRAGAEVVAGVAIGRVITIGDPRYPTKDEMWERQRRRGFSFDRCCLELEE